MKNIDLVKGEHILSCAKLYVEVFNSSPWNDEWTIDTACKRLNDMFVSPGFKGFVYLKDEEIVGVVFGNLEQYYNGMHYNLREIFIKPSLQGEGIGSELINELENSLKNENLSAIILFTSNEYGITSFYEKREFKTLEGMNMMVK
ncbi:MAG: GNAT family N-acetyltransferase [Clostridium sp.]